MFNIIIIAWKAAGLSSQKVLESALSPTMFKHFNEQRDEDFWWKLSERIHQFWFPDRDKNERGAWTLVEELMKFLEDPDNWCLVRDSKNGHIFIEYCANEVKGRIEQRCSYEEFSGKLLVFCDMLIRMRMWKKAQDLARAVGKRFPELAPEQMSAEFPEGLFDYYALGALETMRNKVSGSVLQALAAYRRLEEIGAGQPAEKDAWIGKTALGALKTALVVLLELPVGASLSAEGHISDLTAQISAKWPKESKQTFADWLKEIMPDHRRN